jgi:hypothetical protein
MSTQEKIQRLYMAIALIQDADAGVQSALEDTEKYVELQCGFESMISDIRDVLDALESTV